MVSHDDNDNTGGMQAVLDAVPVGWVRTSLALDDVQLRGAASALRCVRGSAWQWDGVRFALLHPAAESYNQANVKDNDRSCVLRVEAAGGRIAESGDRVTIDLPAVTESTSPAARPPAGARG